jgi:hypothetical protein
MSVPISMAAALGLTRHQPKRVLAAVAGLTVLPILPVKRIIPLAAYRYPTRMVRRAKHIPVGDPHDRFMTQSGHG